MIASPDMGLPPSDRAAGVVTIERLWASYHGTPVLRDLTLLVASGTVFGLVGPEGAGKSTLIRVIAALQFADAGRVVVGDVDVRKDPDRIRRSVGYVPQARGSYLDISVIEYLDFFGAAYGLPRSLSARLRDDLLDLMDLVSERHQRVDRLSDSKRQRLSLARALLHDPNLLLIDQTIVAVDAGEREDTLSILRQLRSMRKTIILTCRSVNEVQDIATDIGVLREGAIVVHSASAKSSPGPDVDTVHP